VEFSIDSAELGRTRLEFRHYGDNV